MVQLHPLATLLVGKPETAKFGAAVCAKDQSRMPAPLFDINFPILLRGSGSFAPFFLFFFLRPVAVKGGFMGQTHFKSHQIRQSFVFGGPSSSAARWELDMWSFTRGLVGNCLENL